MSGEGRWFGTFWAGVAFADFGFGNWPLGAIFGTLALIAFVWAAGFRVARRRPQ